ncbi:hypothetical protein ACFL59_05410 [Planctomycetota bacterium]
MHEDEWVLPERKKLLDAVADWLKDSNRGRIRHLPEFFSNAQRAGNVVVGMSKRQVVDTKDQAYPIGFDRVRIDSNVYDGWHFPNGSAFFFENDLLFKKLPPVLKQ